MTNILTSKIVENQLPDFVKSEHPKFVTFIKKYYEWLESSNLFGSNGGVHKELENIRYSNDIDLSNEYYLNKLREDLTPYFPQDIVSNKRLFLKLVSQFYKSSGTQDSIKFLFRALYNEEIEIFYPKEDVIKTSDGKWFLPLALRLDTSDNNIFKIAGRLLIGQKSKATAVVEKVISSVDRQLGIPYIEAYISNIERLFETGETVYCTFTENNTEITVYARLIGALSEIKVDPNNRGEYYKGYDPLSVPVYEGDPVSIVGGLNPDPSTLFGTTAVGALAYVGTTTKGSITDIQIVNGGFGFREPSQTGTIAFDFVGGFRDQTAGWTEAGAKLDLIDQAVKRTINVSSTTIESLSAAYSNVANMAGIMGSAVDANTADPTSNTINVVTTYQTFDVYPMSFISLDDQIGGGGGYLDLPTLETYSFYNENALELLLDTNISIQSGRNYIENTSANYSSAVQVGNYIRIKGNNPHYEDYLRVTDVTTTRIYFNRAFTNTYTGSGGIGVSVYLIGKRVISDLGSLGRINIINGGSNYAVNNVIRFEGGSGYGANAIVSSIHTSNSGIKEINFVANGTYIIGGEGYTKDSLPTPNVISTGTGAILQVSEIMGDGEAITYTTTRIGSVSSIRIVSYGYDYVSAPMISLRNIDILTTNITSGQLFVSNTLIYQGGTSNTTASFRAFVDSYDQTTGLLRVYNYSGAYNPSLKLRYDSETSINAVTADITSNTFYGDGRAKATAKFENGLIRLPGIYLNTDGQPSSDKKIQDGEKYHNFSYIIKTETDYNKFKKPLVDIVHPAGTKTFVIKLVNNNLQKQVNSNSSIISVKDLSDTVNVLNGSNIIVSSNGSANLETSVSTGDIIVLNSVSKSLSNTVNVISGSNILFGHSNSVNFINDVYDGANLQLSTGNTVFVKEVINSTHLYLNTEIFITSSSVTLNLINDILLTVNTVSGNTIYADRNLSVNANNILLTVQSFR